MTNTYPRVTDKEWFALRSISLPACSLAFIISAATDGVGEADAIRLIGESESTEAEKALMLRALSIGQDAAKIWGHKQ